MTSLKLTIRRLETLLASLALPMGLAAQGSPQDSQIRVSTHLVQFGVIVRDAHGPVSNLTQDDFVVLDRGKPQAVRVFSTEPSGTATQAAPPLALNEYSDQASSGAASREA